MSQYLPQKPAAIPLIAALAANSHFLYANIGVMTMGIIPYVLEQPSSETVKATNWFIDIGSKTFVVTGVASSALFASVAYYAADARVQQLGTVAAVSLFTVMPYTVAVMLPINNSLKEMETGGPKALEGKEEKALEKIKIWRARHMVRMALGTVAWVAGIAALQIL